MLELTCIYKCNYDGVIETKVFDDYGMFGKWLADNATEIILIDVIQESSLKDAEDLLNECLLKLF